MADAVKAELKLPALAVEFVPLTAANRFEALQQGRVDLSCGTDTPTLERRALVDFSIPIFFAGTGALLRSDADRRLRDALDDRPDPAQPVWRGAPGLFSEKVVFAAVGGTTIEKTLIDGLTRAAHHRHRRAGGRLRGRRADGARPARGGAVRRPSGAARRRQARRRGAGELMVVERSFTREPLALAMRRGDDAFRLLVDRSLSRLFRSPEIGPLYTSYFGAPDPGVLEFFQSVALPD